jgi:hypothetical protein
VKTDGTQTQSLSYNSANQISNSGETYDGGGKQTATNSNGGWTMTLRLPKMSSGQVRAMRIGD